MKEFFHFSPSERRGVILLVALILAIQLIRWMIPYFHEDPPAPSPKELALIAQWEKELEKSYLAAKEAKKTSKKFGKRFKSPRQDFNPNNYKAEDWEALGFSIKQAAAIVKYKNARKGFKTKKDVKGLFCMPADYFNELEPFILLPDSLEKKIKNAPFEAKTKEKEAPLELNSADSLQLIKLKGIGPYWAKRILRFRNQWGGFYSSKQLLQMKGFPDSVFVLIENQVIVDTSLIKKIPINTILYEDFKKHPLSWYGVGKSIVNYRDQHGDFRSVEDFRKIYSLKPEQIEALSRYIEFK
ncbi:MAG: helix-hairpin-helix domain-containing protein [Bacteroidia bacterium]